VAIVQEWIVSPVSILICSQKLMSFLSSKYSFVGRMSSYDIIGLSHLYNRVFLEGILESNRSHEVIS